MQKEVTFDLVGKIGSMALIRKEDHELDYNIFSRIASELTPGMIWISSGATEIGRLDYSKRTGRELVGDVEEIKTDYAAQGQAILMETYRRFTPPNISLRQLLVEHQHFNDVQKREHIHKLLVRAAQQGAVPIINYNDAVSFEENRKMELSTLRQRSEDVVQCVDNDETAAVVCDLVRAKVLLIMTSAEGIYLDARDPSTLVEEVTGRDATSVLLKMEALQESCVGASRQGAGGAYAKLEYCKGPVKKGTRVIIGHARQKISQLLDGSVKRTMICIE